MSINPVAFELGPLEIRWYGILIASAVLIGTLLALREVERQRIDQDHFLNILLAAIPAAFIGSRAYYVIFNWDYYSNYPRDIIAIWEGGLAIHGGLLAAFITAFFLLKKYNINFWQGTDTVAPSIVLGQAIGRWGNFFNQEAYGYTVDPDKIPWAMYIDGAYRHPTFLYESLWNLGVFAFLLWLRRRASIKHGDVILSYAVLYSVGRFIIEGFRTDSLMLTPGIRVAQAISILIIIIAGGLLYYRHKGAILKGEGEL
ncbi:MAG: prolipoprotein diacylglyceryl transferase [Firmicutes bacterium HGW-Firmicutes-12]|jgi:phosphatidylglycerol:prolipoprotein diacylglycerol transferase|nr:MAG: prolipoprotein diacylglyceryl transferase [Firmicutes bacterium HGW-Firmicutes-12]